MRYFENKVIWITGASSGIGEGFVRQLSKTKCTLIISARRKEELERVKQENGQVAQIHVIPLDLVDANDIEAKVKLVESDFDHVDMVIHCSGISQRDTIINTSMDVQRRLMEVNYFGTIHLTTLLLPKMKVRRAGHHVVITSVMGMISVPQRSGYAASKHALHGFFDSLRAEHYADNLLVTLFCPGYINTNLSYNALTGNGQNLGSLDEDLAKGMTVDEFCKKAVKDIVNKKKESYIGGFKEVSAIYVKRFFPSLFSKIARKVNT